MILIADSAVQLSPETLDELGVRSEESSSTPCT
jgi:hypothetical protein